MTQPTALVTLNVRDHYRRDAFIAGLKRLGYNVVTTPAPRHPPPRIDPTDVLLIWNRQGQGHKLAQAFEAAGAAVLVAENGYLGDMAPGKWFALSLGHHLGAGRTPYHGPERFDRLGVELNPWRTDGSEVVILAQRGIGEPGVAMPLGWPAKVKRHGRVRPHPGSHGAPTTPVPLEQDLRNARAALVWASAAGFTAMRLGVPVFHGFERWIGAPGARWHPSPDAPLPEPLRDDAGRLEALRRAAWGQFRMAEIDSGEGLRVVIDLHTSRR